MKVGVIMGSVSDYEVMADAVATLEQFGVDFEKRVVSAHRTPDLLCEYAKTAKARGIGPRAFPWPPRRSTVRRMRR